MMQKEIDSAVQFICGLLRARSLSLDLVEAFRTVLCEVVYGRYEGHWFPDKPSKGSAYRCMRINDRNMDPLILKAGIQSGLTISQLFKLLPSQLTIWVDPDEVAYRIGEDGSIGVLYSSKVPTISASSEEDSDISESSSVSSVQSSPSHSPLPSSAEDEVSSSQPSSPLVYGSCRQELLMKQRGGLGSSSGNGAAVATGGSNATAAAGEQYLNAVLITSS